MIFFSPSTLAFFDSQINQSIPPDAIEVTQEQRRALLDGEAMGMVIAKDADGRPVLQEAPPPPPPQSVSMRQARLALLGAGLLATVNAAIADMPGAQGEAARIEWEFAADVRRDSPLVQALVPVLELDDASLDALFMAAAAL